MSDVPKGFERVRCKCPHYKGSDFWNDPHRWCGVDAPTERVWNKEGPADCERTVRPVAVPVPTPDPYRNMASLPQLWMYQNYLGQMATQQSLGGLFGGIGYPLRFF